MYQVKIEFKRIQTYLFQIPRLKVMIGANTLLGETTRVKLTELAKKHNAPLPKETNVGSNRFPVVSGDPLQREHDDPASLFQQGVICRDGGRFIAIFPGQGDAEEFAEEAEKYTHDHLPELRLDIKISEVSKNSNRSKKNHERAVVEMPQFQVCQESGNGPASEEDKNDQTKTKYISLSVKRREEAYDRFKVKKSEDLIGLLYKSGQLPNYQTPSDFDQLCGQNYMAVVHIDGNSMGKRYNNYHSNYKSPEGMNEEQKAIYEYIYNEQFWHSVRGTFRSALKFALKETFKNFTKPDSPYQLLMLGGDDLVMACRAGYALPFVKHFAWHLKKMNDDGKLSADKQPLTIGAGVVISRPNFPFHQLHKMAEKLAGSAKYINKDRELENYVSVVDWMVVTASWSDDPLSIRKKSSQIRYKVGNDDETILLTCKPYPILGEQDSLEQLLAAADKLREAKQQQPKEKAARSQLYAMVHSLAYGRRYSELNFDELPEETKEALKKAGFDKLWKHLSDHTWKTSLADFQEIYEIPNLGKKNNGATKI